MKIYKIAYKQYRYLTNCVSSNGRDIEEMVDNSKEVSWEEFNRYVSDEEIINAIGDIYGDWLAIQDDYAVSFHESKYKGEHCYYLDHSSIEYIFI